MLIPVLQKKKNVLYVIENNCSLAVIFTCGNTRYFTAGDSYSDESDRLVSRYGTSLKCDIMKMNHHGIGSGNSVSLLEAVQHLMLLFRTLEFPRQMRRRINGVQEQRLSA